MRLAVGPQIVTGVATSPRRSAQSRIGGSLDIGTGGELGGNMTTLMAVARSELATRGERGGGFCQPCDGRVGLGEHLRVPLHGQHRPAGHFDHLDHAIGRVAGSNQAVTEPMERLMMQAIDLELLAKDVGSDRPRL
jgi:hypothetical protein